MQINQINGLVLRSTPYKSTNRIITLFTPESGIMTLFSPRITQKNTALLSLTSPFCLATYHYKKGSSNLPRLIDGSIIDLHLNLRSSLPALLCAGKILNALLKTQMPGKKATNLFNLCITYLTHLSKTSNPETLWTSFALKLLKYEGLLDIQKTCTVCQKNAAKVITAGESQCSICSGNTPYLFSSFEWSTLILLTHTRIISPLLNIDLTKQLTSKINTLFYSVLEIK